MTVTETKLAAVGQINMYLDSGYILKLEPNFFMGWIWGVGEKGWSKDDFKILSEQLEGQSCHELKPGQQWVEWVWSRTLEVQFWVVW